MPTSPRKLDLGAVPVEVDTVNGDHFFLPQSPHRRVNSPARGRRVRVQKAASPRLPTRHSSSQISDVLADLDQKRSDDEPKKRDSISIR